MGIFSHKLAAEQKAKKRIAELKKELAHLTKHSYTSDFHYQGKKMIKAMKNKGHDALDIVNHQMHDVRDKMRENPAITIAILAGIGAITAIICSASRR